MDVRVKESGIKGDERKYRIASSLITTTVYGESVQFLYQRNWHALYSASQMDTTATTTTAATLTSSFFSIY
jgi:hypothetical protein